MSQISESILREEISKLTSRDQIHALLNETASKIQSKEISKKHGEIMVRLLRERLAEISKAEADAASLVKAVADKTKSAALAVKGATVKVATAAAEAANSESLIDAYRKVEKVGMYVGVIPTAGTSGIIKGVLGGVNMFLGDIVRTFKR